MPSPSLRGSGLKCMAGMIPVLVPTSPSLRGSGLKSATMKRKRRKPNVSLFTREWIEIFCKNNEMLYIKVSLFTREWIEIGANFCRLHGHIVSLFTREWIEIAPTGQLQITHSQSPSLRGSGLKFSYVSMLSPPISSPSLRGSGLKWAALFIVRWYADVSLFTREWIEIPVFRLITVQPSSSPSLRGSGLKLRLAIAKKLSVNVSLFTREWIEIALLVRCPLPRPVSLFTREWIEIAEDMFNMLANGVSLFTREWIEIPNHSEKRLICCSLPLYEGVDWNRKGTYPFPWRDSLPLYEGVDWNWVAAMSLVCCRLSPSLRGSGLKSLGQNIQKQFLYQKSPSLRGSGLKFPRYWLLPVRGSCLPLYEGVDWNHHGLHKAALRGCLPLYEGVDWNKNASTIAEQAALRLPLYEGVDWNKNGIADCDKSAESPSLRGSGLK